MTGLALILQDPPPTAAAAARCGVAHLVRHCAAMNSMMLPPTPLPPPFPSLPKPLEDRS